MPTIWPSDKRTRAFYFLYRDPKMIASLRTRLDAILSAPPKIDNFDFHQRCQVTRITAIISQDGNAYEEGLSQGWNPIQKYWKEPTAEVTW